MNVAEYEKCVLSAILRFANSDVPIRAVVELQMDKFGVREHRTIYTAIQDCVNSGIVPDTLTVATKLGPNLENVGGIEYLQGLKGFLAVVGVDGHSGFDQWVRVVDNAGRLRHLGLVLDNYSGMFEDFDRLVSATPDVDEFLTNFMRDVNHAKGMVRSSYRPFAEAVAEDRGRLDMERKGTIVDIIPVGWPSLESFSIPRPKSLGVIAGITSMGKTQFGIQMLLGAAIRLKKAGLPGFVAINELESQGYQIARRLGCCLAGVDNMALSKNLCTPKQYARYIRATELLEDLPILFDDNPDLTTTQFTWEAVASHIQNGPRVMGMADYIELFRDRSETEELRVANMVRGTRHICWETGSCEIVISQFNNSVLKTSTKIGGPLRTRYSGAVAHAADWFVEIYNPVQMTLNKWEFAPPDGMSLSKAYALISKNKDYATGFVPFEWIPTFTRFRDPRVQKRKVYAPVDETRIETDWE